MGVITTLKKWLESRERKHTITTIVVHGTSGKSASSSIEWLKQIGLSYHYVIERDGSITKCVPYSRVAFHAGKSEGPNGSNVNNYSIGISFANMEDGKEKISTAQYDSLYMLIVQLKREIPAIRFLTTHYAISPGRKSDPIMMTEEVLKRFAKRVSLTPWVK